MSLLSWIADRLILVPSVHPIDPEGKIRVEVKTKFGFVELWKNFYTHEESGLGKLRILKFPGTAGRAERSGVHPAELLMDFQSELLTLNPHGYGGSSGTAAIKSFPGVADTVFDFLHESDESLPLLVVGNSLGCVSALYLAARYPVTAVMLRNPPPIHQLISTRPRYASWNFGMSKYIANEVPTELDSVANATQATMPCLFVQSEKDRMVPVKYQNLIIDAYAGPKRVFVISNADHHELVGENQQNGYVESIAWLNSSISSSP